LQFRRRRGRFGGAGGNGYFLRRRGRAPLCLLGVTRHARFRLGENALVFLSVLKKVGNIKEGVAFQTDVHKR
jgi:hypothetical protein